MVGVGGIFRNRTLIGFAAGKASSELARSFFARSRNGIGVARSYEGDSRPTSNIVRLSPIKHGHAPCLFSEEDAQVKARKSTHLVTIPTENLFGCSPFPEQTSFIREALFLEQLIGF
uniref:Uncharacterized protein n=1 Tax=Coccidioides posadasii RMSCC 3488 TaxID=454284 RepID=A0A0J6FTD8_COCPO|nr:hypothetical protein CPAG_08934 [Coccidioides posadasii RMSCC 3488]